MLFQRFGEEAVQRSSGPRAVCAPSDLTHEVAHLSPNPPRHGRAVPAALDHPPLHLLLIFPQELVVLYLTIFKPLCVICLVFIRVVPYPAAALTWVSFFKKLFDFVIENLRTFGVALDNFIS